jgi:uncharacterized protein YidB (DUF937 family)
MGLLDSLIGAAMGGGQHQQQQSPLAAILMQLLAGQQGAGQANFGQSGMGGMGGMGGGGGLGGGLGGLLGGLLGGGQQSQAGGGAMAAGLSALLQQFSGAGYGQQAQSWVGRGQNQPIDPDALVQVFGRDKLAALARQHNMPMDAMLSGLSQQLPQAVDEMTPDGQVPDADGMAQVFRKVAGKDGGMKT